MRKTKSIVYECKKVYGWQKICEKENLRYTNVKNKTNNKKSTNVVKYTNVKKYTIVKKCVNGKKHESI